MKLKDFDFRVWYSDSESLLYANKEHLFLGYSQRECGEVIQEYGELEMHAYLNDEPLCPDACEIELFTGFCDTNGKRIYEGDIVEWGNFSEKVGVIVSTFRSGVKIYEKKTGEIIDYIFIKNMYNNCSVIGNIHENPELLGGEE